MVTGGPLRPETVADALSSKAARLILSRCIRRPIPAKELSEATGVPLASAYRTIHDLVEKGLLVVERSAMTPDGKAYDLYRSRLQEAALEMMPEQIRITWEVFEPVEDRLMNMWRRLGEA